jgi:hypothetical protein
MNWNWIQTNCAVTYLVVVFAELFSNKLFETIRVLRLSGPSVRFLQTGIGCFQLTVFGVDAGRRAVEESLNSSSATSSLDHIEAELDSCQR